MTVASQNDRKKKVWVAVWLAVMCLIMIVSPFAIKIYFESKENHSSHQTPGLYTQKYGTKTAPFFQVRIDCDYGMEVVRFVGWVQQGTGNTPSRMVVDERGNWLVDVPSDKCFFQRMEGTTLFRD